MRVQEAVAAGFVRFGHIRSELNIADIATKPLGPLAFHRIAHPYLFRHLIKHTDRDPSPHPTPYRHYTMTRRQRPHSPTNLNLVPTPTPSDLP